YIQPLVFKRLTTAWPHIEGFEAALAFYGKHAPAQSSRQKALRSFPVSADSFLDDWARKSADPLLRRSLGETFESAGRIWGLLPDTWKLDSPAFLDIVRDKLVAAGILTSA